MTLLCGMAEVAIDVDLIVPGHRWYFVIVTGLALNWKKELLGSLLISRRLPKLSSGHCERYARSNSSVNDRYVLHLLNFLGWRRETSRRISSFGYFLSSLAFVSVFLHCTSQSFGQSVWWYNTQRLGIFFQIAGGSEHTLRAKLTLTQERNCKIYDQLVPTETVFVLHWCFRLMIVKW